jgi:hypothetical protein
MFRHLLRAYLINRLLQRSRRRSHHRMSPYSRRSQHWMSPYPRRRHRRTGMYGPFPYYSTRTRGGSRVTVSGCCLPIPLGLLAATAYALRVMVRR